MSRPTASQIDRSYHPKGYGMSPSLKRARKPFLLTNALIGGTIIAFALGVYVYSISAVKQDDFSDVEDLLPPIEERSKIKSIEDENKETNAFQSILSALPSPTSSPASPSKAMPDAPLAHGAAAGTSSMWGMKRLSDIDWIKKRGLVDGKGNVLVWGAPNVDHIGRMSEGASGKRLV